MTLLKSISFTILIIFSAVSQANDIFRKDITEARQTYLIATEGNKRAIRKSIMIFRGLEQTYPNSPLVLAYKGGSLSLRGIDIGARPLDRMRETEEGLAFVDKALRRLKRFKGDYLEAVETRLVAAFTFINIPDSIFHRYKSGFRLISGLLKHPRFNELPDGLKSAIYFAAATAAEKKKKLKHQQKYLRLTIKADPKGENSIKAQALLNKLEMK